MRNRLSYYSVLLLGGLAIVAALVFTLNPFDGAPAATPQATQGVSTGSKTTAANAPPGSNGGPLSIQAGSGFNGGLQAGGSNFDGDHHHHETGGYPGDDGGGAVTNTTTTTTSSIYGQDE